jgi:hypothetical protein
MREVILLLHVVFGVLCMLGSVWIFVDVLNARTANLGRIRALSLGVATTMWLAIIVAGYWYLTFYAADKKVILAGPWPAAHDFFMETKEHLVITLLLLATFLPIAAANNLAENHGARRVMLWTSALTALLALAADGMGGIIALGAKLGLMPH